MSAIPPTMRAAQHAPAVRGDFFGAPLLSSSVVVNDSCVVMVRVPHDDHMMMVTRVPMADLYGDLGNSEPLRFGPSGIV